MKLFLNWLTAPAYACIICVGLLITPAAAQNMNDPLTCLLVPARVSDIGSDIAGIVSFVAASRADYVEAGDILVQMDDAFASAEVQIAEITITTLAARIERSQALRQNNLITRDEMDSMQMDLALAQAEQARARLQVERSRITAPFAGYVSDVLVSEGELIGSEPMIQLIDMTTLKAEMVFLSDAFGVISVGDVILMAVDLTQAEVQATVTAIDPFLDASSNTFSVRAEIDNSDLLVPAGTSCRVVS
jgi:membrane fusion protein (multidrug efflux system)